jgi:hypothetical protein
MTDNEFDVFLEDCYQELQDKQASLGKDYGIGSYGEYWLDQTTESIQFKDDGTVKLEFAIVPVGSWSSNGNSWQWAWANKSFTDSLKSQAEIIKGLASYTGFDIFEMGAFEADENMAHELTAMAVHYLDALGMYIVPSGNLKIFFALIKPI